MCDSWNREWAEDTKKEYYQATDQRFLGDEAFVEAVAARTTDKDIEPTGPRASFERLLEAVINEYEVTREQVGGHGTAAGLDRGKKAFSVSGAGVGQDNEPRAWQATRARSLND